MVVEAGAHGFSDYLERITIGKGAKHPSQWTTAILNQLGETWKASERLSDADLYPAKADKDVNLYPQGDSLAIDSLDRQNVEIKP